MCAIGKQATLHALTVEDHEIQLSPKTLDLLELQEIAEAEQLSLSCNALSGGGNGNIVQIRALVQNKVILLLIDTGSSHSFVSTAFVNKLHCPVSDIPAVSVRVANNETMQCNSMVKGL